MESFLLSLGLAALLLSGAVAQKPAYLGALLIEPGVNNGKCLTAASNNDGAVVTIQGCTGADAQKWTFDGGSVKVFGNKCLDVTDGSTADGVKLQIWTCNVPNANQQFFYTSDYHLAWTDHGKCMDLTDGNQSDGNRIQLWACSGTNPNQVWNTGYMANALPQTSESGQSGTNNCGTGSSQTSQCQTAWINDVDDFCLWAPPNPGSTIGDTEREEVAWCTKSGRGARTMPAGTLTGVHFVKTPDYVQVTGVGDFTKINIRRGDQGGELDPHGADGNGNPIGGLVFGNTFGAARQYHEWTSFISDTEFCFRACIGPNAARNCQHIYDVMGCFWNMPANYDAGTFESCDADDDLPMGVYGTSTWFQGVNPTPPAHPAASSSNCRTIPTVTASPARRRRDNGAFEREFSGRDAFGVFPTPAP
ncbi:carbohydrate-binding module family 13 protein [Pleurotus ostreatus PC15]|uniref:Carbohydrate-binding module family 13 protein n=1 Tax=Pleurotus ostreatus (strain PC15) TaxID=1137138 RepID=A0A067NAE1_PLEO1|nr:carbohydrate-binding module family 13 protein [Pleurotus ostreatus PC15]